MFENSNVTSQGTGGFPRNNRLAYVLEDKSSQLYLLTSGADARVPNVQISVVGDHARKVKTQLAQNGLSLQF